MKGIIKKKHANSSKHGYNDRVENFKYMGLYVKASQKELHTPVMPFKK